MSVESENQTLIESVLIDDVATFTVCPGITGRRLHLTDFIGAWVYDFEPGTEWPAVDHHEAEERYYVVSGEIVDNEIAYSAGSYVVMHAGSSHRPGSRTGGRILGVSQVLAPRSPH